jgi:hypothetical protein
LNQFFGVNKHPTNKYLENIQYNMLSTDENGSILYPDNDKESWKNLLYTITSLLASLAEKGAATNLTKKCVEYINAHANNLREEGLKGMLGLAYRIDNDKGKLLFKLLKESMKKSSIRDDVKEKLSAFDPASVILSGPVGGVPSGDLGSESQVGDSAKPIPGSDLPVRIPDPKNHSPRVGG